METPIPLFWSKIIDMRILRWLIFNLWYFRNPPWDTGISPPELVHFISTHPAGRALDMGCGTGTNAITLAKNGWQVTGVDFALPAIRSARRKAKQAGVRVDLHAADVTQINNLSGPFDLILDIGCCHSLNHEERLVYLSKIERWLSNKGVYLVYLFIQDNSASEGPGISTQDLDEMIRRFSLIERQDGTERGQRPSSWLTLMRADSTNTG